MLTMLELYCLFQRGANLSCTQGLPSFRGCTIDDELGTPTGTTSEAASKAESNGALATSPLVFTSTTMLSPLPETMRSGLKPAKNSGRSLGRGRTLTSYPWVK